MGRKSVAARAARDSARKRMMRMSMDDIYKSVNARYPDCAGMMADCPQLIEEPRNPPEKCRICPNFMESRYHKKDGEDIQRIKELHSLFASIRKTHEQIEDSEEKIGENMSEKAD